MLPPIALMIVKDISTEVILLFTSRGVWDTECESRTRILRERRENMYGKIRLSFTVYVLLKSSFLRAVYFV